MKIGAVAKNAGIRPSAMAGFTIAEIKVLFNGFEQVRPASVRWKELAQKKWTDMESQIERLKGMQRLLEKSTHCRCIRLEDCGRMMLAQSRQAPDKARKNKATETGSRRTCQ
jgi:DNA-binding transcriptional MerR regulator